MAALLGAFEDGDWQHKLRQLAGRLGDLAASPTQHLRVRAGALHVQGRREGQRGAERCTVAPRPNQQRASNTSRRPSRPLFFFCRALPTAFNPPFLHPSIHASIHPFTRALMPAPPPQMLKRLPADSSARAFELQQVSGALLLERIIPAPRGAPAAPSAVQRRGGAPLNPAAVIAAQHWCARGGGRFLLLHLGVPAPALHLLLWQPPFSSGSPWLQHPDPKAGQRAARPAHPQAFSCTATPLHGRCTPCDSSPPSRALPACPAPARQVHGPQGPGVAGHQRRARQRPQGWLPHLAGGAAAQGGAPAALAAHAALRGRCDPRPPMGLPLGGRCGADACAWGLVMRGAAWAHAVAAGAWQGFL